MKPNLVLWTKSIGPLRENHAKIKQKKGKCWESTIFWDEDENILNVYKISANLLLKIYGEANLITDFEGAKLLKDIRFTKVDTYLEDLPINCNKAWSLGKVYACKILAEEKKPFFIIDPDTFLTKKLPQKLNDAGVFAQNLEYSAFYDYQVFEFFNSIKNKYILEEKLPLSAYNCAILGGNDFDFFKFYTKSVFEILLDEENLNNIKNHDYKSYSAPTWILEQYLLNLCAEITCKKIETLVNLEDRKHYNINQNLQILHKRFPPGYFHLHDQKKLVNGIFFPFLTSFGKILN
jgi:hypothetical protein